MTQSVAIPQSEFGQDGIEAGEASTQKEYSSMHNLFKRKENTP